MPIQYEDAYLDDCLDDKRDVLIQSAFRCADSIKKEEAKRQKEAFAKKTRIVKPVDFSVDYWKKWKRDNKKALVNQIKARERRCYEPHYGRVTPLHQIGPSLSASSKYSRVKGTTPFSQPPLLSSQHTKNASSGKDLGGAARPAGEGGGATSGDDATAILNIAAELNIDSDFLERFSFLGGSRDDGKKMNKKKKKKGNKEARSSSSSSSTSSSSNSSHHHHQNQRINHHSSSSSSRGISFGRSTREEWNRMSAPPINMMVSPAAYDVNKGLKATLPNHGTFIFTGLKNAMEEKKRLDENGPGPGQYDTSSYRTRPIRPVTFLRAPREDIGRGGGGMTSSSQEKPSPGPQDYHVQLPLPHVPAPAFNGLIPYERPSSGNNEGKKMRGIEKLEGFGHQCDFAQHVCYGKCLDEGCSQRGLFEQTRARLVASKKKKEKEQEQEEKQDKHRRMTRFSSSTSLGSTVEEEETKGVKPPLDEHGLIKPIIIQSSSSHEQQQPDQRRRSLRTSIASSASSSCISSNPLIPTSTTLHHAVQRRELAIVDRLLKEETCDINARDGQFLRTPLHWAAEVGDFRITKRLVENDLHPFITPKGFVHPRVAPKLDLVDKNGDSVMHLATRGGHWYIVELLYKAGAKCDVQNDKGATPIDDAKTNALCSKLLSMMEVDKAREQLRLVQLQVREAKERVALASSAASIFSAKQIRSR